MTLHPTLKQLPEHGSCFLCGSENPHNIGIHWFVDEKGVVSSEFTLTLAQQGPPRHAHGGLSAAVSDEVMGAARFTCRMEQSWQRAGACL